MSEKKTGEIIEILPTESGTSKAGKDWKKLTFAIDTKETYNNIIAFELFGEDKVDDFLKYNKVGRNVDVDFNISSNKWKDRYFTSASAWKVSKANDTETGLEHAKKVIDSIMPSADEDNNLPF